MTLTDEVFDELNEYFGLTENKNADHEQRVKEINLLQKFMINKNAHFAISNGELPGLKSELGQLFGETDMSGVTKVDVQSVITISLKTENDMQGWSDEVADERTLKIAEFYKIADSFVKVITGLGEWADFVDPEVGKPWLAERNDNMICQTSKNFNEIDCLSVEDFGCCEVLSHEQFGSKVFVGTIVTSMDAGNMLFNLLKQGPNNVNANKLASWSC